MSSPAPPCGTIEVYAFRGDRSLAFRTKFQQAMDDAKQLNGPGPSRIDCLLYAGHTGVSIDGATIYGFNPNGQGLSIPNVLDGLKNGDAFPGVVLDDTAAFLAANRRKLHVWTIGIVLPEPERRQFKDALFDLVNQRKPSQYSYGFPNGDGDCNCTTWLERMGLPLVTGRMNEFDNMLSFR